MSTMTVEEVRQVLKDGRRVRMTVGTDPEDPVVELWLYEGMAMSGSVAGWSSGVVEPVCEIDSNFLAEFLEGRRSLEAMPPVTVPADARLIELPYSEVAMHMRVAGTRMWVAPVSNGMAQLYDREGQKFSFPITRGEAGWRN